MAMNKQDSRKLYQEVLNLKGKISIYKEYIDFYKEILAGKTAKRRAELEQKQKEEIESYDFYLKDAKEVIAAISEVEVKKEEEKLNLQYRKVREANKRAIAKDASKEVELNASLAELKKSLDVKLVEFKANLEKEVIAEKEANKNIDFKKLVEEKKAAHKLVLEKFDVKEKENNEKRYAFTAKKNEARINKLEAKLKEKEVQLNEINEAEKANFNLPEKSVLKVEDLCMYFGGLHAVDHLNFEVKKGQIYGLIGPNGAGKTTVFNCITQFYKPTAGNVTFRTREGDIIDLNKEEVHNVITLGIARTFQNVEVIPECTVLENLLIAANRQYQSTLADHLVHSNLLRLEEQVITQRAMKVLNFMGLAPYAYNFAMGLPYGVLKKIEIARTLMTNPQLIILDEPAAGLNDSETKELSKLIKSIQKEYDVTILLVEHDMSLVMSICDEICAISFGKLLGIGSPKEIQSNKAVQEAYLGAGDDE